MTEYLTTPEGRRIAYDHVPGQGPTVVFLGGFRSDMEGTKAVDLRDWARNTGQAFLRFDYSGHGVSEGRFEDGCIGDWFADARAALALVDGPVVLVGSSMGGWIALLLARAMPERVAGLVGIAAAPDFTDDLMWDSFTKDQRAQVMAGAWAMPSPYGDPTPITRRLIEDGRDHFVLRSPLDAPFPLRLLQGTADAEVPVAHALKLIQHVSGTDKQMTVIGGADHRFSTPECLAAIRTAVSGLCGQ